MANSKSAEKRDRQRETRRLRNRLVVGRMRSAIKAARTAVESKAADKDKLVAAAVSSIHRAVAKGSLKKNTAARYVSRLMRFSNKA